MTSIVDELSRLIRLGRERRKLKDKDLHMLIKSIEYVRSAKISTDVSTIIKQGIRDVERCLNTSYEETCTRYVKTLLRTIVRAVASTNSVISLINRLRILLLIFTTSLLAFDLVMGLDLLSALMLFVALIMGSLGLVHLSRTSLYTVLMVSVGVAIIAIYGMCMNATTMISSVEGVILLAMGLLSIGGVVYTIASLLIRLREFFV